MAAQKKAKADAAALSVKTFNVGMRQMFMDLDSLDVDRDRTLDFYEFAKLIKEREMGVHTLDMLRLRFDHLDVDGSGLIDYPEFVVYALRENTMRTKISPELLLAQWDTGRTGRVTRPQFRSSLRSMYGAEMSDAEIDRVFSELDYDKTNVLEKVDLDRKLCQANPLPNGMQTQQLRQLDWRDNDNRTKETGRMRVGGGVQLDTSKAKGTTAQRVKTMRKQLLRFLQSHSGRVNDLFRAWDTNGDGLISKAEMRRALLELGYDLTGGNSGPAAKIAANAELDELFATLDKDGSGTLEYGELVTLMNRSALEDSEQAGGDTGGAGGGGAGGGGAGGGGADGGTTATAQGEKRAPSPPRNQWVNPNSISSPIATPLPDPSRPSLPSALELSTKHAEESATGLIHSSSALLHSPQHRRARGGAGGSDGGGGGLVAVEVDGSVGGVRKSVSLANLPRGLPQREERNGAGRGAAAGPPSVRRRPNSRVGELRGGLRVAARQLPLLPEPATSTAVPPFLMTGGDFGGGGQGSGLSYAHTAVHRMSYRHQPRQRVVLAPPPKEPIEIGWPDGLLPDGTLGGGGAERAGVAAHEVEMLVIPSRGGSRESHYDVTASGARTMSQATISISGDPSAESYRFGASRDRGSGGRSGGGGQGAGAGGDGARAGGSGARGVRRGAGKSHRREQRSREEPDRHLTRERGEGELVDATTTTTATLNSLPLLHRSSTSPRLPLRLGDGSIQPNHGGERAHLASHAVWVRSGRGESDSEWFRTFLARNQSARGASPVRQY